MVLMIDRLATRYHSLPSEVLRSADTFDLYVLDQAMAHEWRRQNPGKLMPNRDNLSVSEMQAMIDRVKQRNKE